MDDIYMRLFIIVILVSVCLLCAYAQTDEVPAAATEEIIVEVGPSDMDSDIKLMVADFDYKKTKECTAYKALRAVGWSAFGVGIPITLGGLLYYIYDHYVTVTEGGGKESGIPKKIMIAGASILGASIPILICAYYFKDRAKAKAAQVKLAFSTINTPKVANVGSSYAPALSFSLTF